MAKHIHKRFTDEVIKDLMESYKAGEISRARSGPIFHGLRKKCHWASERIKWSRQPGS